ncbi:hypothetical protein CNEO2_110100 [Clostridium neonatale]|nr:hypothetical protein CNEO2_110100 [Clostridium neonatale]
MPRFISKQDKRKKFLEKIDFFLLMIELLLCINNPVIYVTIVENTITIAYLGFQHI